MPNKERIAPQSRDVAKGVGQRLMECKCLEEIDRRMKLGWTTPALAKAIVEEFQEMTDLSDASVKHALDVYRSKIPPTEFSVHASNSPIGRAILKKLANGINELEELEKLYKMQEERIQIDVENEKKLGKLFGTTGREVYVAMKILRQSAELKMDLGLIKRQIGTMEVTGSVAAEVTERYGKESVGKVIADPESRRKILGLAERLIQLGSKASLDVVEMAGKAPVEQDSVIDMQPVSTETDEAPQLPAHEGNEEITE